MAKASRDKGKRGEREAAEAVRTYWGCPECIRSAQVSGKFAADLLRGLPNVFHEVKRYARIPAIDWLDRAAEDAAVESPGSIPVVLMRDDGREDWVVMLRIKDTPDFASILRRHLESSEAGSMPSPALRVL